MKVSLNKIQEIDTTLYYNLSNPVVMTKRGYLHPYSVPLYPPIVPTMRHVHTERAAEAGLLIGRRHGIVLDHSRGKCLGTPLPSVRGDGEQNGSPEAKPMTPLSAKYAEVTGFLLGKS